MLREFEVLAMNPPGFAGSAVAVAASRAGLSGGLALEHSPPSEAARLIDEAIGADVDFTVSIATLSRQMEELVTRAASRGLKRVILCDPDSPDLERAVATLRSTEVAVFIQATCLEHAQRAEKAGADGVVVKGSEAGGRVGEETTYILLQRIIPQVGIPVLAHGGVGLYTSAACRVAGAAGVVLDWQLAIAAESELPDGVKTRVRRMDGGETAVIGQDLSDRYRAYVRPGETAVTALRDLEAKLSADSPISAEALATWREAVEQRVSASMSDGERLLLIGQDAAFAVPLAEQFRTVRGVGRAIVRAAHCQGCRAARHRALEPGGPLAASHGTRYPIAQGPMTRVSDTADFAQAVADGGGLPFLALALLRGPQVAGLLKETKEKLEDRPWGVGILGFVPRALREEQLAEVHKYRPPFALIAGGRPDQARSLEEEGVHTYLHVPSPGLLRMFLESGTRRVIFEGRECGGHVGPRSSFVLWESMIRVILDHLRSSRSAPEKYHVLFAGGVHDALSAAMVAALASPLSEIGVRIGVLMGTAYLFTQEAVETHAIVDGFQQEALACRQTRLLQSGVGHATRCADTPFADAFAAEKRRLTAEGRSADEIRDALEALNLGRLRVASKGVVRNEQNQGPDTPRYADVGQEDQRREGMYMIGQVAALRDKVCTIEELHAQVSRRGGDLLQKCFPAPVKVNGKAAPSDVAIVGMSCLLPKAGDVRTYWENIVNKVIAYGEVPLDRWDWRTYYDQNRTARDKVYSKWGGFIDEIPFDPTRYGMPPNTLSSVEPLQLLVLEAVRAALEDAGYADRPFDREHASVILGAGGGVADLGMAYGFRSLLPYFMNRAGGGWDDAAELIERLGDALPEWTEDSFPGLLTNVAAGRVANRFDFGGTNFTVDAACASSLAAVRLAVDELETGSSDVVVVGGADTMQSPFAYLSFSKTYALSATGISRPFDNESDGIVISEGIAMCVLKRLADAERDGDRIYAVIKGVGSSSDGKDKGLTAPRPAGQMRAVRRAWEKAGSSPATVGLIEAHGTGTVVGDQAEAETVSRVLTEANAEKQSCALGSVKSLIGHTKCTAGVAGLVKAALALHHKVLPATAGIQKPNSKVKFEETPVYVNSETRPWIARPDGTPRRAGVSAFGFGGTNFHAALEEYQGNGWPASADPVLRTWPAELFVWRAERPEAIVESLDAVVEALEGGAEPLLRDLASAVCETHGRRDGHHCLTIVAESIDDLKKKLAAAKGYLAKNPPSVRDPRGVYYSSAPLAKDGKVAFVFPGQGSQRVNMLRDLAVAIPEVRAAFEAADRSLGNQLGRPLSSFVYPKPVFTEEEQAADAGALTQTNVAQPALGAADLALYRLISDLGIGADMSAGHSYGEYVALCAAGGLDPDDLIRVSEARGRFIVESTTDSPGTMAAVEADEPTVAKVVDAVDGVWIANVNAPAQTVISGTEAGIAEALRRLEKAGISARQVFVSRAFHTELVRGAQAPFAEFLNSVQFRATKIPVYSNTTAAPHSQDPDAIRAQLVEHLAKPVLYRNLITSMYEAGARIFIEIGPGKTQTGLVENVLDGKPILAVSLDQPGRPGLLHLNHTLAQLAAAGVRFDYHRLFDQRIDKVLDLDRLVEQTKPAPLSPVVWMVNGKRAVPSNHKNKKSDQPAKTNGPIVNRLSREASAAPAPSGNGDGHGGGKAAAPLATSSPPASPPVKQNAPTRPAQPAPAAPPNSLPGASTMPAATNQPTADQRTAIPTSVARVNPAAGAASVMTEYHKLMAKFLDTQKNVMMAYLSNGAAEASTAPPAAQTPAAHVPAIETREPAAPPAPVAPAVAQMEAPAPVPSAAETAPVETQEAAAPVAEVPVEAAPAEAPAPAAGGLTRERIVEHLVNVVSDRTGYPPEMLDLDLDLEADLGIDSIKRIEILGSLQKESVLPSDSADGHMEELAKLKTLNAIVEWILDKAAQTSAGADDSAAAPDVQAAPVVAEAPSAEPTAPPEPVGIPRMLLETVECPPGDRAPAHVEGGVILITDDERGVAHALAEALAEGGVNATVVASAEAGMTDGDRPRVNLTDPETVSAWVERVRQKYEGRILGVVHLLPLADDASGDDTTRWPDRLERDLTSLFLLTQAVEEDLRKSGSGCVMVGTRMGGTFAFVNGSALKFWPGHGGVSGFVKSLGWEWPEVACKVVDFAPDEAPSDMVARLLEELNTADGIKEVGRHRERRITLQPTRSPLNGRSKAIEPDSESVVLITGGARGITAEVAIDLARHYQPTLVLAGRSPLPPETELPETTGRTDMKELKQALREALERSGEKATPAKVEAAYNRLLREREMRANLAAMREAGAKVHYHSVDVRDAAAFGALIDEIYSRFGRLDGVIHGAGITEDKFLRDKALDSFRRVVLTKVNGAWVLASKLRSESLKFLFFFSSVAARYGNRGQCDYAAANDVLNKLAVWLNARWPGRVASLNWGPWESTGGMVSAELAKQFAKAGLQLISRPVGRQAFLDELLYGQKNEVEVVLGGPLMVPDDARRGARVNKDRQTTPSPAKDVQVAPAPAANKVPTMVQPAPPAANRPAAAPRTPPLLTKAATMNRLADGSFEVIRELNVDHDLYLTDHVLDEKPVMPMAMVTELISEVAAAGWPKRHFGAIHDLRVLRGIVLENGPREIRLVAKPGTNGDTRVDVTVQVAELTEADADAERRWSAPHYRASVEMAVSPPSVETPTPFDLSSRRSLSITVAEAYAQWLFHGPLWAGITEVEAVGDNGIIATLSPSSPRRCLLTVPDSSWLIDPVMVDSGLQLLILWARTYLDMTPLPSRFGRYRRFLPPTNGPIRCEVRLRSPVEGHVIRSDLLFFDAGGALIGWLEDMEVTCSKALNRLAGTPAEPR